jgi:hypothetical protein
MDVVIVLRVDTWNPEYGASIDTDDEPARASQVIEFDVEGVLWAPIEVPPVSGPPCCAFVDGVRRIDRLLFAEEGEFVAPALAGSWGAGVAWSSKPPTIGPVSVGRTVVVGGGRTHPELQATIGPEKLIYEPISVDGVRPRDPVVGLQNEMLRQESQMARDVVEGGEAEIVILDGPLSYFSNSRTVGLIKRQARRYLEGHRLAVLTSLTLRQRTPLFRLGEQRLEWYTWYSRIAERRPIDGTMTGIVRLEVAALVGVETARELADIATAVLPLFSAPPWRDARSPQNLFPVGQLERILRHRLGDPELVRRAFDTALWRTIGDG